MVVMLPATYNLPTGYRGDSYGPVIFRFTDASGSAVLLDGISGALQAKGRIGVCTNVVVGWYTNDSSMTITGNEVRLNPKNGGAMDILPDEYPFDLQLSSGDMTRTYIKGILPIVDDVTEV